ncbi:hypothetical protein AJ78_00627 [Emergomyces pasteurianus Ep9510]|uniref:Stress response protein NST1 n=1 Tax=Emergomyces pasteurianus Ep9510 TaxID=1447872 RepID=A0A1J9QVX9_9EURO|nr:hypothetical protein AJ78_00627 [Emergomyces pasteurianus Ep9510]
MPSNPKRAAQSPATISKQPTAISTSKSIPSRSPPPAVSSKDTATEAKQNSSSNAASSAKPNSDIATNQTAASHVTPTTTAGVNRKKQKRRQKQAARQAAEQQLKGDYHPPGTINQNGYTRNTHWDELDGPLRSKRYTSPHHNQNYFDSHLDDPNHYDPAENDDLYSTDDERHLYAQTHAQTHPDRLSMDQHSVASGTKSKKKKGKKHRSTSHLADESSTSLSTPPASTSRPAPPPPPPLSNAALRSAHKISKDRIWNTSTQEERENIKEFWLQLGEEERRSLVKVEKEAVLRKMKEQQKHSCSCTVCGRKRTAIEEELEVLYDAYYEELEQYANHSQSSFENGGPIIPPRLYQPPLRPLDKHSHISDNQHPPRGRVQELPDDDEDLDEDYDEDDEEDEPYSDDELEEATRNSRADFFAFGNSLTVKDGILTVADDLLKNDGKHFIDMMEQLAERRMQREEDTQYAAASAAHQSLHAGHNHGPPLDDEDFDDEEDDDYDSQEDEDYEEDEMDAMTEEQRMEEGRRMFQIFAARMFEQRVLTAYREKVAHERQLKLIEELEEENRLDVQREAKKAREAQKRKDKKRQQKQAKEEEKARKEAERAAEAAAAKAIEEKKLEEQRRKKEEQRKKREAEKKAQEEERVRKEAEKQKRLQEERERQAEIERKQREQKEREKKKREEAKKKEREEREAKEREIREKKAKEEQERKAREEQAKLEKEAALKAERESKERAKREEQAAQAAQAATAQAAKRISQSGPTYLPPGLQHPQGPPALQSPHFQVATPVVPKAPTPVRPRQTSQQGSHASSPRSQPAGPDTSHTSISPGNTSVSQSSGSSSSVSAKSYGPTPMLHHPQPAAPLSPLGGTGRGPHSLGFSSMPALNGISSSLAGLPGMTSRIPLGHEMPMYPNQQGPLGAQFRGFPSPDGIPMAPGINGTRPMIPPRGFPPDTGHGLSFPSQPLGPGPISSQQPQIPRETGRGQTHSRQASASFERSPLENQLQNLPISRPAPIQRPTSTTPHDTPRNESKPGQSDIDDLSAQLGSSALLDDTDVPLTSSLSQPITTGSLPGAPGAGRMGFGTSPLFSEPLGSKHPNFPLGAAGSGNTWGSQAPFGAPGFPASTSWGSGPGSGSGWSNNAFGIIGVTRPHTSRPVTIRLLVAQACKQLNATSPTKGNSGFHNVNHVLRQVKQLNPPNEPQITLNELLDICDTEGNPQNGGGSFAIKTEGTHGTFVRFEPDNNSMPSGPRGSIAPGDIGSPIPSSSILALGGIGAASGSRQFPAPSNMSPPTGF